MKGKTQQMKIKYLLIPLMLCLVGCKGNDHNVSYPSAVSNNHISNNVYINVVFYYTLEEHCYRVYVDENKYYSVPPKNVYLIDFIEYLPDMTRIRNEYFVSTNELFVYDK